MTAPAHTINAGVLAHAMRAVAGHLFDNRLPVPISIDFYADAGRITIQVAPQHVEAWTASLYVDQVEEDRHDLAKGRVATHVKAHGRLPDTGVRVTLLSVHFTHRGLQAVPQ